MKTQYFKKHWKTFWLTLLIFSFLITVILAVFRAIGITDTSWFIIFLPVILAGVSVFLHLLGFIFFVMIVIFTLFDERNQKETKT
jgi:hypothetical protein